MTFTDPRAEHRPFTVVANAHAQRALAYLLPIVNGLRQRENCPAQPVESFVQECFESGLWSQMKSVQDREDLSSVPSSEHGTPEIREEARALLLRLIERIPQDSLPPEKRLEMALPRYVIER